MGSRETSAFLGVGWGFPPSFSRMDGGVGMVAGVDDIRESLRILFATMQGERLMQPDYGCDLWATAFTRLTPQVEFEMREMLTRAILRWEPRIDVLSIEMQEEPLEGTLLITVDFFVRQVNTRSNLVYPFSLREATISSRAG